MEHKIKNLLSNSDNPLSANDIGKLLLGNSARARDVNPILYRMKTNQEIYSTDSAPPLWYINLSLREITTTKIKERLDVLTDEQLNNILLYISDIEQQKDLDW